MADEVEHGSDSDDAGTISMQQMTKARRAIDFLSSLDLPCSSGGSSSSTRPLAHRRVTQPSWLDSQAPHPSGSALGGIYPCLSRVSPTAASPTVAQARTSRECTNYKYCK